MVLHETMKVSGLDDSEVEEILAKQGLGLKVAEARKVCDLLGRDPTLVELTIFDTMWSEHCSYKSSRQVLQKFLPTKASNVVMGPGQDAGIIDLCKIDGVAWCLVIAHESHNHPSQVLPFEGAATGIGGIVRDVYCMGADVIAVLDPLRFGDPLGPKKWRVREIVSGVVHGIWSYGNALGVPNFGGDIYFDRGFDDNCLVNVVAVGLVRKDRIVKSEIPAAASKEPYDVILVGKPTDASGFGGAAFASDTLDDSEESRGAVQVPDPFLKRVLSEANRRMLDRVFEEGAEIGFKDLGAGGISCALSEMGAAGGFGVEIDLDSVPLEGKGLQPRVVACSETQERFALAVPQRLTEAILGIYNEDFDLPHVYYGARAAVVGRVTQDPTFTVISGGTCHCRASNEAITTGIVLERPRSAKTPSSRPGRLPQGGMVRADLIELMARPNITSRAYVFEQYDSEVQGRAVLRPGEADAGVLVPFAGSEIAVALSCDGLPEFPHQNPYFTGAHAVLEAARNVACVGGRPAAITDCLNYGSPEDPEVFHSFVEGVRGIGDAARALGLADRPGDPLPVVSGNVSFYNQSEGGRAIPASPIVTCVGIVKDYSRCRGMNLKREGNELHLMLPPKGELGGSEYQRMKGWDAGVAPELDFDRQSAGIRAVVDLVEAGLVESAHDVSLGGILVSIAEMTLGRGRSPGLGARILVDDEMLPDVDPRAWCFAEEGSILVEILPGNVEAARGILGGHSVDSIRLGSVTDDGTLSLRWKSEDPVSWELAELNEHWSKGLERTFSLHSFEAVDGSR